MIAYGLAACLSIAVMFSISPERLVQHALTFLLGFCLLYYLSRQEGGIYTNLGLPAYILTLVLLAATLVLGENVRGSIRWINIGSFQFQASEFTKPLLILAFAYFFQRFPLQSWRNFFLNLLFFLLPVLLVFRQPDLGTALVLTSIWCIQFLVSGAKKLILLAAVGISVGAVLLAPSVLHTYQLERLTSFFNPAADPLGSGYNVIQSIVAVGSGGLFGKGLGHGTQSQLRFLPERHTDFVFASLAEELGLVGGMAVLLTLTFLLYWLLHSLMRSDRLANRLVLAGVFGFLSFQTFINIGMNLGLAPVTGITLPLISYGGSSILATAVSLGIAAALARTSDRPPVLEIK